MFDLSWISNLFVILFNRKKVLLWGHGYGKSKAGNIFRTMLVKISKALILYEENEIQHFLKNGISKDKLFFAGNTVDVKNHGFSKEDRTQFIYVGRLQKYQRSSELIQFDNL